MLKGKTGRKTGWLGMGKALWMFAQSMMKEGIGSWMVLILILSIVVGNLLPDDFIKLLDNAGIVMGIIASSLAAAMGLWVWKERESVRNFFLNNPTESDGEKFSEIEVSKILAMIIPVSRMEQPEWILYHLRPKRVMFLYTQKSHSDARKIFEKFSNQIDYPLHARSPISIYEVPARLEATGKGGGTLGLINNPYNPEEVYNEVKEMLDQLINEGYSKDNIFVDTTGGTVPMSIGAFMAAEEKGITTLYVVATKPNGKIEDPQKRGEGKAISL